jgi:hypothetical protein
MTKRAKVTLAAVVGGLMLAAVVVLAVILPSKDSSGELLPQRDRERAFVSAMRETGDYKGTDTEIIDVGNLVCERAKNGDDIKPFLDADMTAEQVAYLVDAATLALCPQHRKR